MPMKLLQAFWRYWTWVCVALVTTCLVFGAMTLVIQYFKKDTLLPAYPAAECLEQGGTWDAEAQHCRYPV